MFVLNTVDCFSSQDVVNGRNRILFIPNSTIQITKDKWTVNVAV